MSPSCRLRDLPPIPRLPGRKALIACDAAGQRRLHRLGRTADQQRMTWGSFLSPVARSKSVLPGLRSLSPHNPPALPVPCLGVHRLLEGQISTSDLASAGRQLRQEWWRVGTGGRGVSRGRFEERAEFLSANPSAALPPPQIRGFLALPSHQQCWLNPKVFLGPKSRDKSLKNPPP